MKKEIKEFYDKHPFWFGFLMAITFPMSLWILLLTGFFD